jgi:hypothetical protein
LLPPGYLSPRMKQFTSAPGTAGSRSAAQIQNPD